MPLEKLDVEMFLNRARIDLPGASDSGIKIEMWAAIHEFLKDSNAWIETVRLPVVAGTQTYLITPLYGGQIIRLNAVRDGNFVPVAASMPDIPMLCVNRRIDISSIAVASNDNSLGSNHPWWVSITKNITLPRTGDELPVAPSFVLSKYQQHILDGVSGRMMLSPAKTYSNIALGKYHLQRFRDGIGEARSDVWNQNVRGGQRWAFPQTFSTHSQRSWSAGAYWPPETF